MTLLLDEATKWLGTVEVDGPDDSPTIMGWAHELVCAGYDDFINYKHDSEPWCALGMAYFAYRCGIKLPPHANWSIGWKAFGSPREGDPQPGDVVVTWRQDPMRKLPDGSLGHVQIFVGIDHDKRLWRVIGCNQSDKVSEITRLIGPHNLVAVRIPPEPIHDVQTVAVET